MKQLLFALALCTSCAGPRIYNCPKDQVLAGFEAVEATFPEAKEFIDRLDFSCKPHNPLPEKECVTWGYGTGQIPGQRAEVVANVAFALECAVHEPYHGALNEISGDGCASHEATCDWDKHLLEAMVDAARNSR